MAIETAGFNAGSTTATTLTSGGSSNTKGSYAQLIASTTNNANGLWLYIQNISAGSRYALDLAFGTTVKFPNLILGNTAATVPLGFGVYIPLVIPSSTQLQARISCVTSSQTISVTAYLDSGAPPPLSGGTSWVDYGTTVGGATTGTTLTVPGSNNTPTANYDQISASVTADINCLILAVYGAANTVTAQNAITIGKGAAASETAVISNILVAEHSSIDQPSPQFLGPFFVPTIASGTRLAALYQTSDITQSAPRIAIYGTDYLPYTSSGSGSASKLVGKVQ